MANGKAIAISHIVTLLDITTNIDINNETAVDIMMSHHTGDLENLMVQLSNAGRVVIFASIFNQLTTLVYIHRAGIAYLDIKIQNILVDYVLVSSNGYKTKVTGSVQYFIADFGFTQRIKCINPTADTIQYAYAYAYTFWFRPPEILAQQSIDAKWL
jgi:serine/threonine protein kinase